MQPGDDQAGIVEHRPTDCYSSRSLRRQSYSLLFVMARVEYGIP